MPTEERPLPLYVARKTVRGHCYYYFRWLEVYRRLPDDPASQAFRTEYARALASISSEAEVRIIGREIFHEHLHSR